MHFIIKFIHLVLRPILSITPWMKHHSTLLKALLMSSLVAMKPSFLADLWFRKCINSKATIMLSMMRQSDVKALWFSMMICGRRAFSLLASVFEMSLYTTLHKLMGQKSVILFGLFVFGMRDILVLLSSAIDTLLLRTLRTMLVIPLPTIFQYF